VGQDDAAFRWRFSRALARVGPVVEEVLAEYASAYWGRPFRRHDDGARVRWLIEREAVVELAWSGQGPATLLVHDIALLRPLRRRLRTRHVRVEYA